MDFGTIMGDIGEAAGRTQIAGARQEHLQATADDARAQAQMRQMSALSMQQDVTDRKAISDETRAATEAFQKSQKTAADVQKLATAKEGAAISHNQFDMAKGYGEMAKMAEAEQKTALENKAKEKHDQNEGVAQAAQAYETLPTVENARLLANRATQAGVQNIPPVGTPAFASWAVGQKTAAMDSGKLLEWQQKEKDVKAAQELKAQKQKEDHEDRLQKQRDLVDERAGRREDKHLQLQILREGIAARKEIAADRLTAKTAQPGIFQKTHPAQVESGIHMIIGSAGEAMNAFDNILEMPASTTSSVFADLASGTVPEALTRSGTQAITPEHQKVYNMFTGGLSTEMTRVLTGGGGRSGGQQLADELRKTLRVEPNDSQQMAAIKTAYGIQMLRNRLHYLAKADDPSFAPLQQELVDKVSKFPSPGKLLKAFESDPKLKKEWGTKGVALQDVVSRAQAALAARDQEIIAKPEGMAAAAGGVLSPERRAELLKLYVK